jgi:vitamin B12 transporter
VLHIHEKATKTREARRPAKKLTAFFLREKRKSQPDFLTNIMVIKPKRWVFGLCVFWAIQAHSQQRSDSVRFLNPVLITQSHFNNHVLMAYSLPVDSLALAQTSGGNLTDLIRKNGLGHLRSYGPGGLASPSFRGSGSSHTAILWNGISLTSPLTGQQDLSLLPVSLFDQTTIQTGGASSLFGNGSIGGTIQLNNTLRFQEGLHVQAAWQTGSFKNNFQEIGSRWSGKKFGWSFKVFHQASENNFPFTNTLTLPAKRERRQHNAFKHAGFLNQYFWQASPKSVFSFRVWYQQSHYKVPNAITLSQTARATEENSALRLLTGWDYDHKNVSIVYQGAYMHQTLDYRDPVIQVTSLNQFTSLVQNAEIHLNTYNQSEFTGAMHYTREQGQADAFGETIPVRNRLALATAYTYPVLKNLRFALSLREELINGNTTPIAPKFSILWEPVTGLSVFSHVSRNYRLPTFNDLFWLGAGARGNKNLKPELSISYETGLQLSNKNISGKLVMFSNLVDDWILWSPDADQVWSPINIKEVWSRGTESQISWKSHPGKVDLEVTVQYSLTLATTESIYEPGNRIEIGKQLALTPIHEGSLSTRIKLRGFHLSVVNSYTGQQFTDDDNSLFYALPPYWISNIWLSKVVKVVSTRMTISFEINNLFNTNYQARPGYPLPGINYRAGLQFNFTKTQNL